MRSKWKIWDFFASNSQLEGLVGFYCYDQYAFKYIKDNLAEKFVIKFGHEITPDWVDQKLRMMDLFGGCENYLIHFAEAIPTAAMKLFEQSEGLLLENRLVIFNFTKENDYLKKWRKWEHVNCIEIQAPAFWEEIEMLNFLCDRWEIYLGYQEKQYFCEQVPFEIGAYTDVLSQLKINTNAKPTLDQIKEHIQVSKFDHFHLAELFGNRKLIAFYRKFLSLVEEQQDVFRFLYFMHTHMSKVHHKDYQKETKRLSKYDKQIINQQKIWKTDETARAVNYFNDLLSIYKLNKKELAARLKRDYLKLLG